MSKLIDYINSLPLEGYYSQIFGEELPNGKFFCPFHYNVNTPAAKVYGNVIHCFSCNRNYGTYDLLKKFLPEEIEAISQSVLINSSTSPSYSNNHYKLLDLDKTSLESIILSIKEYEAKIHR